jgi:hypothetical protein
MVRAFGQAVETRYEHRLRMSRDYTWLEMRMVGYIITRDYYTGYMGLSMLKTVNCLEELSLWQDTVRESLPLYSIHHDSDRLFTLTRGDTPLHTTWDTFIKPAAKEGCEYAGEFSCVINVIQRPN